MYCTVLKMRSRGGKIVLRLEYFVIESVKCDEPKRTLWRGFSQTSRNRFEKSITGMYLVVV
jgi:hypothetical protein